MLSKLQDTTTEVTSFRQYSPAEAGVANATMASAHSAAMDAALDCKSCFILLFRYGFSTWGLPPRVIDMVRLRPPRYRPRKKTKPFPYRSTQDRNSPCDGVVEV